MNRRLILVSMFRSVFGDVRPRIPQGWRRPPSFWPAAAHAQLTRAPCPDSLPAMNFARRHRRGLALLAALAVALNALAGAFHVRPLAAAGLVDEILGPLTICSSAASEPVSPAHGKLPEKSNRLGDCPLCLRASAALLLPASPEVAPPEFALPAILALSYERWPALANHLGRGGVRSRAPPAAA